MIFKSALPFNLKFYTHQGLKFLSLDLKVLCCFALRMKKLALNEFRFEQKRKTRRAKVQPQRLKFLSHLRFFMLILFYFEHKARARRFAAGCKAFKFLSHVSPKSRVFKTCKSLSLLSLICLIPIPVSTKAMGARPPETACLQTIRGQNGQTTSESLQRFLREKILTASRELKAEFIGQDGLALLAEKHFEGEDLSHVFQLALSALPKLLFDHLSWKIFYGSPKEWERLSHLSQDAQSFVENFEGLESYLPWADRHFEGDMEKAFLSAKALLPRHFFDQLNWDIFYGSTQHFEDFRNLPLFERGKVHEGLKNLSGYVLFSLNITQGNMKKAYMNLKAVLNEDLMNQLEWPYFDGYVMEFENLKNYIFKIKGRDHFIKEFKGSKGFSAFVEQYHWIKKQSNGDVAQQRSYRGQEARALNHVLVVLGSYYNRLEWGAVSIPNGSLPELASLRGVLFQADGQLRDEFMREFKGADGYLRFSEQYFKGDMRSAFEYAKTHLKNRFYWLRWIHRFDGMAEDFKNLREKILNESQEPKTRFRGEKGLTLFANIYFSKNRQTAFDSVSKVLNRLEFNQLTWKDPQIIDRNLNHLKSILFNRTGGVFKKWIGMEGYLKLSIEHYPNRSLRVPFDEARLLGGRELIRKLKWKIFYGSPQEFLNFQEALSEREDLKNFLKKFKGFKGQILFVQEYSVRTIEQAFSNVFALLNRANFNQLEWRRFNIPLDKLSLIYDLVLDEAGAVREIFIKEYKGIKGQALFAERFLNGNMYQSYLNIWLLMGIENFQLMEWKKFNGSVDDFNFLKIQLFDEEGAIRMEYRGRDGFLLFCETYFPNNDMWGVYRNVFIILGKERFQQINWQIFRGLPDEFKLLKNRLINEDGSLNSSYRFIDGMIRFALEHFNGDLRKTFDNVFAALDLESFNQLKWNRFYGPAGKLEELTNLMFKTDGAFGEDFIEKYKGMDGLAKLAHRFKMNLKKIAKNAFLLLQGAEQETEILSRLEWKMFYGSKEDFYQTRAYFFFSDGSLNRGALQKYKGREGMTQFARNFKWPLKRAFSNVSIILPPDIFEQLKWMAIEYNPQKPNGKLHVADLIFNEESSLNENFIERYKGMDGLIELAEELFEGNIRACFDTVSSSMKLFKSDFNRLNWRKFYGLAHEYRNLKSLALNEDGALREEFISEFEGMKGYVKFAKAYVISPSGLESENFAPYINNMERAFVNVSAVTHPHFDQMGWMAFQGPVDRFESFENALLNEDGSIKEEFKGMNQMARFADLYGGGSMILSYRNASALLGGSKRVSNLLGWQPFPGSSGQFYSLIEDFDKHYPEGWIGQIGQKRIADKIFQGDQKKLKRSVSTIRGWLFGEERQLKAGHTDINNPQHYFLIKNLKFKNLNWN